MSQLPLDLGHVPALGREDFLVAPCNAEAVAWLERWPRWPSHGLVLWGPPGCGKTHLLAAFAAALGGEAATIAAARLPTPDLPALIEGRRLILVDDLDGLADEAALFHLHNLVRENGRHMVLASRQPPARLALSLPDLRSRLNALPAAGIGAPDDAVLSAVIVKQFADRQIEVSAEVVAYVVGRMDRSFAAARELVAALDRASLARRRPVTVPLAREVLEGRRQP